MNAPRDPDVILAAWLDDGPADLPSSTRRAISTAVRTTPQARAGFGPLARRPSMSKFFVFAGAAAVVAVAVGALAIALPGPSGGIGATAPTASPSPSPTPSPTTAAPTPSIDPLDTSRWDTYESTRYGFTIGHPAGWEVSPATRDWSFDADADDWLSPAQEAFINPAVEGMGIRVSAWSVPRDPDATADGWGDIEPWVQEYCERTGNRPCTGIHERAVPLCLERRDCHPGLLVAFEDDVQAFFTNGAEGTPMTVVAVWWGESSPAVAEYGGSRKLLEAFLSTMGVEPAEDSPFEESRSAAASFSATAP